MLFDLFIHNTGLKKKLGVVRNDHDCKKRANCMLGCRGSIQMYAFQKNKMLKSNIPLKKTCTISQLYLKKRFHK